MIIGCDIGNVLRDNATGDTINGAIESIKKLSQEHTVIFISKCKDTYKQKSLNFLKDNDLDELKRHFVLKDKEKIEVGTKEKIDVMIDDKSPILLSFSSNVKKLWFTNDEKKITGMMKHNKDGYQSLTVCRTWDDVLSDLSE